MIGKLDENQRGVGDGLPLTATGKDGGFEQLVCDDEGYLQATFPAEFVAR